jgi:hypothetical protein
MSINESTGGSHTKRELALGARERKFLGQCSDAKRTRRKPGK